MADGSENLGLRETNENIELPRARASEEKRGDTTATSSSELWTERYSVLQSIRWSQDK